jgi:hypothetical protein
MSLFDANNLPTLQPAAMSLTKSTFERYAQYLFYSSLIISSLHNIYSSLLEVHGHQGYVQQRDLRLQKLAYFKVLVSLPFLFANNN